MRMPLRGPPRIVCDLRPLGMNVLRTLLYLEFILVPDSVCPGIS